jgi:hypothetical protein
MRHARLAFIDARVLVKYLLSRAVCETLLHQTSASISRSDLNPGKWSAFGFVQWDPFNCRSSPSVTRNTVLPRV